MEKKRYIQPEIEVINMTMDCILNAISANIIVGTDGENQGTIPGGGESGNEGDLFAPVMFNEDY